MTELKKEPNEDPALENADQQAPADEETTTPDKDVVEEVTISAKELEVLKKKAEDFERSIELKRLAKLKESDIKPDNSDLAKTVQELQEKVQATEIRAFNTNLESAYKDFIAEHPWANSDDTFEKIKGNFQTNGTESKDELLKKLKSAVQIAFPQEYENHLEDKIKAKVLLDKSFNNSGGNAGPSDILHKDVPAKTEQDLLQERLGSLLKQSVPWLKNKK